MYILKPENGKPEKYSIQQLRRDNPNVSFPKEPSNDLLASYNVFPFVDNAIENGTPGSFVLTDEGWVREWSPQDPNEALAQERARMVCTRAQGKMAIGPEVWAQVVAMADDPETPWGLKVAIYDTYEWRRLDPDMDVLIWAMGLTPEEADDLFRLAMTL